MYDTVNFWLNRSDITDSTSNLILSHLDDVKEKSSQQSGKCYFGRIDDYHVTSTQDGIHFAGSLANYYSESSSNMFDMTRQSAKEAIEKMSSTLHYDISNANVVRLDFSATISVSRPPRDYFSSLGHKNWFTRLQITPDSLRYETKQRRLAFYDKSKQAADTGIIIPAELENLNLLRYELRFMKYAKRQ